MKSEASIYIILITENQKLYLTDLKKGENYKSSSSSMVLTFSFFLAAFSLYYVLE